MREDNRSWKLLAMKIDGDNRNPKNLDMVFIDLEKMYNRVPIKVLWKVLEKKGVCITYIQAIKDGVMTRVRT